MPEPAVKVLFNHLPRLSRLAEQRAEEVVARYAHAMEAGVKASMATPKSGRTYRIGSVVRRLKRSERAGARVINRFGRAAVVTAGGQSIRASASGKTLSVVTGHRMHQASAPGEAPAIDTGNLVGSIKAKRSGRLQWMVYTNAEYARALEYGNPVRKLAPRPFMRPAADAIRRPFVAAMAQVVRL